jgi:hypothetical protein
MAREEDVVRNFVKVVCVLAIVMLVVPSAVSKPNPAPEDGRNIVIVFKDGHRQTFRLADIARIEFGAPVGSAAAVGRDQFRGEWKVGDGVGGSFFITLEPDGKARKSIGSTGGTWDVVNGEAHISWEDGWHDAIRKVGGKYQKVAFAPGKSFSDAPANVATAEHTEPI